LYIVYLDMIELKAEARKVIGKKVKQLRKTGFIPAVLYGHKIKSLVLSVPEKEFSKIFQAVGETSIINLVLDEKKHNVLIHEIERHPLNNGILHVDFYEVRMDEKLNAKIPIIFSGESPAVKNEGGVLVKAIQEVEIEALPIDLPKEILVDVSILATFEDKIQIKDLKIKQGVRILAEPEEMVASVVPPRSEKELEEMAVKPAEEIGEVKVVGEEEKIKAEQEAQASAEEKKPQA
jgi:large subunit ribosomal protein L25